jgi:hypothetical protein
MNFIDIIDLSLDNHKESAAQTGRGETQARIVAAHKLRLSTGIGEPVLLLQTGLSVPISFGNPN